MSGRRGYRTPPVEDAEDFLAETGADLDGWIGARRLRALLGVGTTQFRQMVEEGCFGEPITHSDTPNAMRYFERERVVKYLRQRRAQCQAAKARAQAVLRR